jgi:stearoyl-CoA desaturase (delta-9 desaturase)
VPHLLIAVLVGLAVCQVAMVITTVFLHRTLSHRALALSGPLPGIMRVLTWLTTGIRPRQWVAVHRKHHAHTDAAGDPHSPVLEGFAAVQFANVVLYRRAARDPRVVARYARDLAPDGWDRMLFDHAFVGLGIGIAGLCLALGWQWGFLAAGVHTVTYLLLNAAVNAVGHTYGRRTYPGYATNSRWLAWLTAGEGHHSNHHAAPTSARLGFVRGEIDPGWWFIRAVRGIGWAKTRHSTPPLARRERQPAAA